MKRSLTVSDYTYDLPDERIALRPLEKREQSKLLIYREGAIQHLTFTSIVEQLPKNSHLFFNDTKVIPARLHFIKDTGADIEIFLLHPITPSPLVAVTMEAKEESSWQCTIGNLKRWTSGMQLVKKIQHDTLRATLVDRERGIVSFSWTGDKSFAEIITLSGETPLPPYLKRSVEENDKERYQTVYAHYEGAVAAPTAGLHFTPQILQQLRDRGIETDFVTLHVSAGTFQPMKVEDASEHKMHNEQIIVRRELVETLLKKEKFNVAVGTTSMRTLESIYWYGAKLNKNSTAEFVIEQNDPYTMIHPPERKIALQAILKYMDEKNTDIMIGETSIFIMPGYDFKMCNGLITNFHQPGSTLILLVAAFVGNNWRKIYDEAMTNGYRFLSYGDSSLLIP